MSFGQRLKERRKQLGITQVQLANMLGITKGAVGNYESEVSSPKAEILYKVFDVLECDANFLFQDEMRALQKENSPTPAEPEVGDSDYDALDGYGLSQRDYDLIYTFLVDLGVLSKGQDITRDQIGVLSGVLRILRSTFSPSDIGSKKDKAV